jgi:hypothetical protein
MTHKKEKSDAISFVDELDVFLRLKAYCPTPPPPPPPTLPASCEILYQTFGQTISYAPDFTVVTTDRNCRPIWYKFQQPQGGNEDTIHSTHI